MKFRTGGLFVVVVAVTATITIGLGASAESPPPLSGVKTLASDGTGFCALLRTTQVECWGNNASGALGDGTQGNSAVPEKVKNLAGVVSLTADSSGVYCAVVSGGTVTCWGAGYDNGQGYGHTLDVPAPVAGLTNVKSLISDNHGTFCALLSTGQVRCWGSDEDTALGNGAPDGSADSALPVAVKGITRATQLASSDINFCRAQFDWPCLLLGLECERRAGLRADKQRLICPHSSRERHERRGRDWRFSRRLGKLLRAAGNTPNLLLGVRRRGSAR